MTQTGGKADTSYQLSGQKVLDYMNQKSGDSRRLCFENKDEVAGSSNSTEPRNLEKYAARVKWSLVPREPGDPNVCLETEVNEIIIRL